MSLSTKIIDNVQELFVYKADIVSLLDTYKPRNYFFELEWLVTWINFFAKNSPLYIILVYENDDLVGFLPLYIYIKRKYGVRYKIMEIIGGQQAGWTSLIVLNNQLNVYAKIIKEIGILREEWDITIIGRLRGDFSYTNILKSLAENHERYLSNPMGVLSGLNNYDSFEEYLKSRDSKSIKNYKRYRRNIEKQGQLTLCHSISGDMDIERYYEYLKDISSNSWQGAVNASVFSAENAITDLEPFHAALIKEHKERFKIMFFVMLLNGKPVSFRYGFLVGNEYTSYAIEYDRKYKVFAPGIIFHYIVTEYLIENKIVNIDYGIGEGRHKDEWSDWSDNLYTVFIFSKTLKSTLYFCIWWLRQKLKPLRNVILKRNK